MLFQWKRVYYGGFYREMIIAMIRIRICKLLVKQKKHYAIKNTRRRQNPLKDSESRGCKHEAGKRIRDFTDCFVMEVKQV
jgi:hypothetical protein